MLQLTEESLKKIKEEKGQILNRLTKNPHLKIPDSATSHTQSINKLMQRLDRERKKRVHFLM